MSFQNLDAPVLHTILLVGRTKMVIDDVKAALSIVAKNISSAINLAEVENALHVCSVSHVFIGAGIELEQRLAIVRTVLQISENTTIHIKDAASGPSGLLPFVREVLSGFAN